ncbi:amylo-alpha-1,6-glucosidase [Candidatus Methylacidiphilum infernorum]|uniref:Amylo-alpha-1,6-glucosidase n=1 Tax=Candidatus Methylacidiphilum infernorum TaxID=511746 RepID=A0ABX7PUH8_9BACT|nr:amylo-alpha-1,6-glucosidase [Candidatus Methylacidiphilum infernorum]QSR86646.1 amylo-alpha-1,6-glucosidase [Candidatus Methylacidiphilum infernorum]
MDKALGLNEGRDFIKIGDTYYVRVCSPFADDRTRVLKHNETFGVFDRRGDIQPLGLGDQGIYYRGTRHLNESVLFIEKSLPLFLSSTVREDNGLFSIDLTNPEIEKEGKIIRQQTLLIMRSKFIWESCLYEEISVCNYGEGPVQVVLWYKFNADFVDLFEVRGSKRKKRGNLMEPLVEKNAVLFQYLGLDGILRKTRLFFDPQPLKISSNSAALCLDLVPRKEKIIHLYVECYQSDEKRMFPSFLSHEEASLRSTHVYRESEKRWGRIWTSNSQFNSWINRSKSDLLMLISETPYGPFPYAGVPWFCTPFGRDGIITTLECLWLAPELGKGVLSFLAANQAKDFSEEADAEPGKILHETREGEMANLGEIPFRKYYGSIDATCLFLILAAEYYKRTVDRKFIEEIWPNIELALLWIDRYGDIDGDGFVEYRRKSSRGLTNQGWKDSFDSIFHKDGSFPVGPIALCEVQGFVYAAKKKIADLAAVLGLYSLHDRLLKEAEILKEKFEKEFWVDELSSYALALDGRKEKCKVLASNAGLCLYTGIAHPQRAEQIGNLLLSEKFFTGWGIRTVAAGEARFNPISYHNGSVWPFDTAFIAAGLMSYGMKELGMKLFKGLFEASLFFDLQRLPELFGGLARRGYEGPTLYPAACSPHAWSSGAVFILLQSAMGLKIDATKNEIVFDEPRLPDFLDKVVIQDLKAKDWKIDIELTRYPHNVGVRLLKKEGDIKLIVID